MTGSGFPSTGSRASADPTSYPAVTRTEEPSIWVWVAGEEKAAKGPRAGTPRWSAEREGHLCFLGDGAPGSPPLRAPWAPVPKG